MSIVLCSIPSSLEQCVVLGTVERTSLIASVPPVYVVVCSKIHSNTSSVHNSFVGTRIRSSLFIDTRSHSVGSIICSSRDNGVDDVSPLSEIINWLLVKFNRKPAEELYYTMFEVKLTIRIIQTNIYTIPAVLVWLSLRLNVFKQSN